jgi:HlyD family secretion protein
MTLLKRASIIVFLIIIGGMGWYFAKPLFRDLARSERPIPTILVTRGDVEIKIHTIGELRAVESAMLTAPSVWGGGSLQILKLAKTGSFVKKGDVVIEIDPSEQEYHAEQEKAELDQAEQQITKAKADADVQASQDQVDLLKARFEVRRAELEVSRNELVSAIDAKKNDLNLEEARRRLAQLEKDVVSRAASSQASIAVMEAGRDRARLSLAEAKKNIENMVVTSPIPGLVAVRDNQDAGGHFFGATLPEYREGDLVFPGRAIAQVLDLDQMEIQARIDEVDRANLNGGQPITLQVESLPGQSYDGRVKTIAGMASRGEFFTGNVVRQFETTFEIRKPDLRLRPGVTARVIIIGDSLKNVVSLPRQALFEQEGRQVAYVKKGGRFEPVEVKVKQRTESQVVIDGLTEGTEVAVVRPEEKKGKSSPAAPAITPALGGAAQ